MGFIVSPFVSASSSITNPSENRLTASCRAGPFLLGFMVATTNFKDVYLVGVAYVAVVVLLITFFMEETMCASIPLSPRAQPSNLRLSQTIAK